MITGGWGSLDGLGPAPARRERHELAVERRLVLGPQPLHRQDVLAGMAAATVGLHPVVLHLVDVPPDADAEQHPAVGHEVERRHGLGEQ
jgi:uncharacterized RmlC-like cupin family protein